MELLSVIVPIYNCEAYLEACVESVLCQTYTNMEIILVDDGSTDRSGAICDSFAQRDKRVMVVHQKNAGVSRARNAGMEAAHGAFLGFVDGDDTVEKNMYQILMDGIENHGVDIACCQLATHHLNGAIETLPFRESQVYTAEYLANRFFFDEYVKNTMYAPFNKVYRRSSVGPTRFRPYALAEDLLFVFQLLCQCKSVYCDQAVGYHYVRRQNSATTSKFSAKRFDYIAAATEIEQLCNAHYPGAARDAHQWVFWQTLITYRAMKINRLINQYPKKASEYQTYLKANARACFGRLPFKRKVDFALTMYIPWAYRVISIG